eukprot:8083206-Prorocentrum_lima.AAC.1
MLIGRSPPFGFLRATTRAVFSHSYASSGAAPRIQTAAISWRSSNTAPSRASTFTWAGRQPSRPAAPDLRRP